VHFIFVEAEFRDKQRKTPRYVQEPGSGMDCRREAKFQACACCRSFTEEAEIGDLGKCLFNSTFPILDSSIPTLSLEASSLEVCMYKESWIKLLMPRRNLAETLANPRPGINPGQTHPASGCTCNRTGVISAT
jgi:hypothetical protein